MNGDYDGVCNNILWISVTVVILIAICFFFSLTETTIMYANDGKLKLWANQGNKKAIRVLKLKEKMTLFLATVRSGLTISILTLMVISVRCYSVLLDIPIKNIEIFKGFESTVADIITAIICAFFVTVFGQLLPKRLGLYNPEKTALKLAFPIQLLSLVLRPLVLIFSGCTSLVLRMLGKNPNKEENPVTEEELRFMVDECQENGELETDTKSMLDNIFEFDDMTVGEITTHRKDLVSVADNTTISQTIDIATKSGYSRIPVYHDSIDDIVGFVYVKDLLKYVSHTNSVEIPLDKALIRKAFFVPKTKSCIEMLDEMRKNHVQIAVVVDEYGGTEGIITMEDLVEVVLGNIQDEYDNEDEAIKRIDENSFTVDGSTDLDEISEIVGQHFQSETCDTIAGLMLERMGHIPKENEHPSVMIDGTRFTVQEVHDRRIEKVLVVAQKNKEI